MAVKDERRRNCDAFHERCDGLVKTVDEHTTWINGDGNGRRGANVRFSILEDNMSLIKFIGGALFLTMISTFATVIAILLRLPTPAK